ncbi:MAG TPA: dephospho-CoA kinase, partial [Vicinamibacteria bacterium]|nr:dephospho-CoA kinase [Vicinamibacteria bacterium]
HAAELMLRVGLTGGIACGKSHVARCWAAAGIRVIDLDRLAHGAIARGGAAFADVIAAFGAGILGRDGSIDRKALGGIVFSDPAARRRLNALVHPRVRAEESRLLSASDIPPDAVVATEAALLVESGIHLRFDRLVVVWCGPEEQIARLMRRDGIDEAAARQRVAAQMPLATKRRFAHFEIDTGGSADATSAAAAALGRQLQEIAVRPRHPVPVPLGRALGCLVHGPARGPRGLDPRRVLDDLVASKGPELERLAALLRPASTAPWYEASGVGDAGPGPASAVAPLVLWALGRGAPDPPFLATATVSFARLTHRDAQSAADACAQALLLQEALTTGDVLPAGELYRLVQRFAELPPSPAFEAVRSAVSRHGGEVNGARRAAREAGGDPELAGMVSGCLAGAEEAEAGPEIARAVVALLG